MNEHEKYEELKTISAHSSIKKLSWASLAGALIVPPAGIIFGHISLNKILKHRPINKSYLLLTIAGLVLGYISTVTLILTIASIPDMFQATIDAATEYKNNK